MLFSFFLISKMFRIKEYIFRWFILYILSTCVHFWKYAIYLSNYFLWHLHIIIIPMTNNKLKNELKGQKVYTSIPLIILFYPMLIWILSFRRCSLSFEKKWLLYIKQSSKGIRAAQQSIICNIAPKLIFFFS